MAEGFLGRWAQRKAEARAGRALDEPAPPSPPPAAASGQGGNEADLFLPTASPRTGEGASEGSVAAPTATPTETPLPTLQDAQALTPESDFKPFLARGIAPEVKNTALRKLFADPHYNVMDRLDIYIDDYGQSEPIPQSMLRQMVSAKFLNLFEEEEPPMPAAPVSDPVPADVSTPAISLQHDDPHLRLQSDDAASAQEPGRGAE